MKLYWTKMADISEYSISQIWLMWCKNGWCYEFQQWSFWLMWPGKVSQTLLVITETGAKYQSDAGSTKRHPYLSLMASHGVSFVNICEKIDRVITAPHCIWIPPQGHVDGLVQERRNSSALAMELRLSCTNPSMYTIITHFHNNTFPHIITSRPHQNGGHLADNISKSNFMNENQCILMKIPLKFPEVQLTHW